MNALKYSIMRTILACVAITMMAACQEDTPSPERGLMFPHMDQTSIIEGETVNFTDYSTRVVSRAWTFESGSPASSNESTVAVQYNTIGTHTATLEVTYQDGTTESESFEISVEEEYVPLVAVEGPIYVFYSEDIELPQDHPTFDLLRSGIGASTFISDAYEGNEAINLTIDPDRTGTFAMLQTQVVGTADITEFRHGYLNLALKSNSDDPIHIRLDAGPINSHALVGPGDYGYEGDGEWHFISIPMEDVLSQLDAEERKMALLTGFNQFRMRNQVGQFNRDTFDFSVDFIFFSNELPTVLE